MLVRDVMTRRVVTIEARASVADAMARMWWAGVRHLPVLEDERVVGIVTRQDLLRHLMLVGDEEGLRNPVRRATHALVTHAEPDEDLESASDRMGHRMLGSLPVLDEGRLVGILTTTDLLEVRVRGAVPEHAGPPAAEVMSRSPVTISPEDALLDAAARMSVAAVRHLPVVDGDGHVVGMLSDRDVRGAVGDPLRYLEEPGPQPRLSALRVRDVMSTHVVRVEAETPLSQVMWSMIRWRVGSVPVVDPDDRLLGVVSYVDILEHLRGRL